MKDEPEHQTSGLQRSAGKSHADMNDPESRRHGVQAVTERLAARGNPQTRVADQNPHISMVPIPNSVMSRYNATRL